MQNSLFQKPLSSVTQKLIFQSCSSSVFLWHTGEHYVQFITLVVFFCSAKTIEQPFHVSPLRFHVSSPF